MLRAPVKHAKSSCKTCSYNENDWAPVASQVDLGEQRRLFCNYYTLRQDNSEEYPRDWMLQGSQDGERWVTMHRHQDDCAIVRPGQFHSWEIDPKTAVIPLRFFMVTLTGAPPRLPV
eukprot:525318-Prorocentrum_minimum.AAC.1